MNESNLDRYSAQVGVVAAVSIAGFMAWIAAPGFIGEFSPQAKEALWTSPLTSSQALAILVGLTVVGVALNLINIISKASRNNHNIPVWLLIGLFAFVSLAATTIVMVAAFGVTMSALASFGAESSIALAISLSLAILAGYLIGKSK